MVLLSDFLKSLESEFDTLDLVSLHEVFKRLNVYFFDEKDSSYNPMDYVGYTSLSYIFRLRGSKSGFLFDYSLSVLSVSSCLYCRPRRACRDWFENVLLPH